MRENVISLRKWSGGSAAQLRTLAGTLVCIYLSFVLRFENWRMRSHA